ncbi:MAG: hypothetical protein ABEJ36_01080 [Candidatus Nanosalina sp.]
MNEKQFLALMAAAGLFAGFLAFNLTGNGEDTYCQRIEQDIQANQTFNGSVACYPPGVLKVNLSEKVEQNTELRCVCRKSHRGDIQYFPITVTQ